MYRVATPNLMPGMILADDVYNYNDQMILPSGFVLNDKAITKLAFHSIPFVPVHDVQSQSMSNTPPVPEPSYSARIQSSQQFQQFRAEFDDNLDKFKNSLNDVVKRNAPLDVDAMLEDTLSLLANSHGSINVFDMLHNMRQYDDLTFAHCLNVALICNVFAGWLGMSESDIQLATQCGLLHDIGKLKMPEDIIKKPARLTDSEYRIIKTHTQEGYQILQQYNLNEHILNSALMHHERCDGFGYPMGLPASKIDPFAQMVAIADVYDAMTAVRVYRGALCPFKVISTFEAEGLQKYNARYIMTFLENITNTYILNRVRLSDGREGEIILINKSALSRPMIRCGNEYIDLSKESSSLIIDAIL